MFQQKVNIHPRFRRLLFMCRCLLRFGYMKRLCKVKINIKPSPFKRSNARVNILFFNAEYEKLSSSLNCVYSRHDVPLWLTSSMGWTRNHRTPTLLPRKVSVALCVCGSSRSGESVLCSLLILNNVERLTEVIRCQVLQSTVSHQISHG